MTYLDTSALVKRFVLERGSTQVDDLHKGIIATAKIAYAELYAGLTRKRREGRLSNRAYLLACRRFEDDWQAYVRLDLVDEILSSARDLIQKHPLRGFDAVHLASALGLAHALGETVSFAAADERLLQAAAAEGLPALDVEAGEVS